MTSFQKFLESQKVKVWHATKEEIIEMWRNLRPSAIVMRPVSENQKGTRLKNDGIRITGSPQFINSILSRIKDLIGYEENSGTRLDLEYRQIEPTENDDGIPAYLCYIHAEQDLKKKNKLIKVEEPPSKLPKIKTAELDI